MNSPEPHQSQLQKPRHLTEKEWHEILHAVNSTWTSYVFDLRWLFTALTAMLVGAFISCLFYSHGEIWSALVGLFHTGILTYGLFFLLVFRIIFSSIQRANNRKSAFLYSFDLERTVL